MKIIVHGYWPGCVAGTPDAGAVGSWAGEVRIAASGSISGPLWPQPSSRKIEISMMPQVFLGIKLERMIAPEEI
jgi:hypothetical protein